MRRLLWLVQFTSSFLIQWMTIAPCRRTETATLCASRMSKPFRRWGENWQREKWTSLCISRSTSNGCQKIKFLHLIQASDRKWSTVQKLRRMLERVRFRIELYFHLSKLGVAVIWSATMFSYFTITNTSYSSRESTVTAEELCKQKLIMSSGYMCSSFSPKNFHFPIRKDS